MKNYNSLKGKDREKIKELVKKRISLNEREKELFKEAILDKLDDINDNLEKFISGEYSLEMADRRNDRIRREINKFIESVNETRNK